jgi:Peptidase family S41
MIRKPVILALAYVLSIACSSTIRAQSRANPWSAMASLDLQGIHDILRDNHPGPVDPENQRYARWLEEGLAQASERTRAVRSYSDYTRVLRFYMNGFQDGHLGVSFTITPEEVRWPGFIIGPDDNGAAQVVYADSDAGVKQGEHLLSCDGKTLDELMKERVDPYFWNSAIPHQRPLHFYRLFQMSQDDYGNRLKSCRLSSGEVTLKWRRADRAEFDRTLNAALGRRGRDPGLKQLNGVWFISVPTLAYSGEANVKKIRAFLSTLQEKALELRKSVVVFDVRGNHGGASAWGEEIASALWGHAWVKYVVDGFDETVDWRASPANIKWMELMVDRQSKAGLAESAAYVRRVVDSMKAANAAGKPLARFEDRPKARTQPSENPVKGKVYLLTDGECASACLDFADLMRRLPGVTQVGLPTSADAIYIDNTTADLPSGLGVLGYSLKVYRNRVRGNNEWYEPQIRWPGGTMTDEALAKWISSLAQ